MNLSFIERFKRDLNKFDNIHKEDKDKISMRIHPNIDKETNEKIRELLKERGYCVTSCLAYYNITEEVI